MQENSYLLTIDDLTYAEIKVGNRSETQTLTISTDADTILIYETAVHNFPCQLTAVCGGECIRRIQEGCR